MCIPLLLCTRDGFGVMALLGTCTRDGADLCLDMVLAEFGLSDFECILRGRACFQVNSQVINKT